MALRQQDREQVEAGEQRVPGREQQRHRAEERSAPEPGEPVADPAQSAGADRHTLRCLKARRSDHHHRDDVGDGIGDEGERSRGREQNPAERRPDDAGGEHPRLVLGDRVGELAGRHHAPQDAALAHVPEGEQAPVRERDPDDLQERRTAEPQRHRDAREQQGSGGIGSDHEPLAIEAIGDHPRRESGDRERDPFRESDQSRLGGRAGEGQHEQWEGDRRRLRAELRKRLAAPQQHEVAVPGEGKATHLPTIRQDVRVEMTGLREGFADLDEVRLHYVEAGQGPLVVLLHGFPEFWFSWRFQIPALVAAGFRVVAPDMRGYNLSSRPPGVAAYDIDRLSADIRNLIQERDGNSAHLAGHDWGAAVAWATAMNHPHAVTRLAILNVPHPRTFLHALRRPSQLAKSWYMFFFQLPWLPERLVQARDFQFLRYGFEHDARAGAFTKEDIDRYIEAWSQPGAPTAMINYYRAVFRQSPKRAEARVRRVDAPTLVIWGERDRYLGSELAEPDRADVPNLERVVRLAEATHWVHHDEPERVSELLVEFFSA